MLRYPKHRNWTTFPLAAFDVETTGLDVEEARIVEIAIVRQEPNGTKRTLDLMIHPQIPIPPAATEVSGITNEDVADAPRFSEVVWKVDEILRDAVLIGHNALGYDWPLLANEYRRAGLTLTERPLLDTMIWANALKEQLGLPRVRLGVVAAALGIPLGKAHRALPDTEATLAIALKLVEYLPPTLAEMLEAQQQHEMAWTQRRMGGKGGKGPAKAEKDEVSENRSGGQASMFGSES